MFFSMRAIGFYWACAVGFLAVKREFTKELCIKFDEETYNIVEKVANKLFEGNKSQAVRYIIRQYEQYTTRRRMKREKQVASRGGVG
jgi:hypothetical protein